MNEPLLERRLAELNVALWGENGHTYDEGQVDRVLALLRAWFSEPRPQAIVDDAERARA